MIEITMEEWEALEDHIAVMEARTRTTSISIWRADLDIPPAKAIPDALWVRMTYENGEEWLVPVLPKVAA